MSDELVVVARATTPSEADAIVAVLDAAGIKALAAHRRLEDVFPTLFSEPGTAVLVTAEEADRARATLDV